MPLLVSKTWDFETAVTDDFEDVWPGYTCTAPIVPSHTIDESFVRDSVVKRFGTRSCKVTSFSNGFHPGDCTKLRTQANFKFLNSAEQEKEHDEGWYGFSVRWDSTPVFRWPGIFSISSSHITHPSYGMFGFLSPAAGQVGLQMFTGHCPSPGSGFSDSISLAGDWNPITPTDSLNTTNKNGYKVTEVLLGSGGLRPLTLNVWHDIYLHVIWKAQTNGTLEIWHREENGPWAKLYSNVSGGGALRQKAPHPTMLWNLQYGGPGTGVGGTGQPCGANFQFYRNAGAATSYYWTDAFRRRQSEAEILSTFPGGGGAAIQPPSPAAGRSRMGFIPSSDTTTTISSDLKRTIRRDSVPASATIDIHTFYAKLSGPPSGSVQTHRAVVYEHAGAEPGLFRGSSAEVSVAQGAALAWVQLTPSTPIRAPAPVSIGLQSGGAGAGEVGHETVTGGLWVNSDPYSDGADNPFGSANHADIELGLVADYTIVSDAIAPTLSSAAVNNDRVTYYYSEELDTASVPAISAMPVKVNGSLTTVSGVSVVGSTVEVMLLQPVDYTAVVTGSYTDPANNKIKDLAGNAAAAFTDQAIDNLTQPPAGSSIVRPTGTRITGTRITGTRIS